MPVTDPKNVDELMVYVDHKHTPTADELGRPARQQATMPDVQKTAYIEGRQDYNIWYDKYLTDRYDPRDRDDRDPALTRCVPFIDSGWTRANFDAADPIPRICLFFAKGCCSLGSECKFLHRIPTIEDNMKLDMLHDIFGRERHQDHRDDMDGVGSFNSDCKSLFIGGLRVNRTLSDFSERVSSLLRRTFGVWGPVESLRVIPNKNIAFIKFKYRAAAEFAKVAMDRQQIPYSDEPVTAPDHNAVNQEGCLSVRWAHSNRTATEVEADAEEDRKQAQMAVEHRMRELGYSESQIRCYADWGSLPESSSEAETAATSHTADGSRSGCAGVLTNNTTTAPYPNPAPLMATGEAVRWRPPPRVPDLPDDAPPMTAEQIEAALEGRFVPPTAGGPQSALVVERLREMQTVLDNMAGVDKMDDSAFNVKVAR